MLGRADIIPLAVVWPEQIRLLAQQRPDRCSPLTGQIGYALVGVDSVVFSLADRMLQFVYPELFFLAVPLVVLFRRWGAVGGPTGWLRGAILLVLLLALTGPRLNLHGYGLDVIVVADRSRSLAPEAHANIRELLTNLQNHVTTSRHGDRLSVVTFGSQAQVEFELSDQISRSDFVKEINPDGSDLHDAILTAVDRVNPNRPARILVLSDGEANGRDPLSAARRAREAGVPVDCRVFERLKVGDVAIESVQMPDAVSPREPFQYAVWIHADRDTHGSLRILRDGQVINTSERDFTRGMNRLLFRDILEEGGFYNYSVELKLPNDPVEENNRGAGLVRVDAGPRVLVLNADGQAGNLVKALQSAKIPTDVAIAANHSLSQDALDRYRGVIIQNVKADDFGHLKMERLVQFVEDLGGGLMITGGQRSFGTGGYFLSPLDPVLPVSMELREEHKKVRAAIVIALDRSGSMTAPVSGGRTKMDLADQGTAACVRMLSPQDMVAVIAVDSTPHIIQPLVHVENKEAIANKALTIQSMGGGIFVYEALVAAGRELVKADGFATRHIILFSDAADSEQPGDYQNLLKKFTDGGITVSVIGLGTTRDPDAKLLEDIAKLGNGNIMFTSDAQELPRLFTQDTMSIARNTFISKDETQPSGIPGKLVPDARLLGSFNFDSFPNADGYNLSYIKPEATLVTVSQDENSAPWSAAWNRGLGRVAAITLEVDGKFSGQFGAWSEYENYLATHARWLLGSTNPDQVFVKVDQVGQEATVSVELDPDRPRQDETQPPQVLVVPPGDERSEVLKPDLVWTGPNTLEARFRMDQPGSYRTLVKTGPKAFARGPAITLPYSPEFAPRLGLPEGRDILKQVADLSGGKLRTDVLELFADPPRTSRTMSLLVPLLVLGMALLLLEIAGRRLSLWERLPELALPRLMPTTANASTAGRSWKHWFARRSSQKTVATSNHPASASTAAAHTPTEVVKPAAPKPAATTASLFEKAKDRARRRSE